MADNAKPEAAIDEGVQATPAPENGQEVASAEVNVPTSEEGIAPESEESTDSAPVDESPEEQQAAEANEEENLEEPFDEDRWRNTLKGFRDREKEAAKKLKDLETQLAAIESERTAAKQKLLTFEEQQAQEENKLKELAEQRGAALNQLEQEAAQRQRDLEVKVNDLQTQNQGLNEEVHTLVDNTIREWPESIKAFIPDRKTASAEVRLQAMRKGERAAEELMDKQPVAGNGPTPVSTMMPNPQDELRSARTNRMYDVI